MGILESFSKEYQEKYAEKESISLEEYLEVCKTDPMSYASPAQRMLKAIGEAEMVDTRSDPRMSKVFSNKVIKIYPAFRDFYGMEETIENIVSYFKHSAQGLEEAKQVLYLLGPVGGGKSSLAEKLKELMEVIPVYVLDGSPVFENPLGLFAQKEDYIRALERDFKIPRTAIRTIPSPWALEKLKEHGGDISKFRVRKMYPSRLRQECISRVEAGDRNNQDISALVGEVDMRMVGKLAQNHPYAYSYSGGLCRGNGGIMEFMEMFKADLEILNPILAATQDRYYAGTKPIGSIPFDGIILAHSNESEWKAFKEDKTNEAFLDRVYIVKVPYCKRRTEEIKIYEKLLNNSELSRAPCAPGTLRLLAEFCVMSRLADPENSALYSKMRVYDGENIKNDDPKAKPLQEYKDDAGVNEGMNGLSTRFAFKVLSKAFNYPTEEVAADPIHLMYILKQSIAEEEFENEGELLEVLDGVLHDKYLESLEKDIRASFLDSFPELCQNVFDTYFYYADAWVQEQDYRDPSTGTMMDREVLNAELSKIEKPADIANPKDFRQDITNFVIRYRAANKGKLPRWNEYEKMRQVIEKKVLLSTDEILPVISFGPKRSDKEKKEHDQFVGKMKARGYTERQTRFLCDWFMRNRKAS